MSDEERAVLESWTARRKTTQAVALRAWIVLTAAGQFTNGEIAKLAAVSRSTVTKWRNRFAARRPEGLLDVPRPGRPRMITDEQVERVIITVLESKPEDATHWSTRSTASEPGVTQNAVVQIWHAYGVQSHHPETWKLSKDPRFIEKVHDICDLNPPERAVVLAVDEKRQRKARGRHHESSPPRPGRPSRYEFEYERGGRSLRSRRRTCATRTCSTGSRRDRDPRSAGSSSRS